ncbi:hypothetical protein TcWFU_002940 [Taenia crassiceps]|uniref:Uncharacterized protein n=1 Tax=Taenia crassiceps TaxID=6207 RepID=A0ABR4QQ38_9CEST
MRTQDTHLSNWCPTSRNGPDTCSVKCQTSRLQCIDQRPAQLARYRDNFFDKGTTIHVASFGGGGGSSSGSFSHPTRAASTFSTEDQSSPSPTLLVHIDLQFRAGVPQQLVCSSNGTMLNSRKSTNLLNSASRPPL